MERQQQRRCVLQGVGDGYPEAVAGRVYFSWHFDGLES